MTGPITMQRNQSDVWPVDEPVGTWDFIEENKPIRGFHFISPAGRITVFVSQLPDQKLASSPETYVWWWDGNEDRPTITPSINWPGNWHGQITNGVLTTCNP